ncbi:hypothetical protein LX32DRAFT_304974 [Colletotrichum zoysiae]|uniref:Uncharacterized protein n=1 Tax=Colletotrichum zoysiae TaxID=1216348 RepID=A0AAD9LW93_9PEZI|nr:hypothetical protein LX32DRAFT_304974 [Colletotrichum zoysiae]
MSLTLRCHASLTVASSAEEKGGPLLRGRCPDRACLPACLRAYPRPFFSRARSVSRLFLDDPASSAREVVPRPSSINRFKSHHSGIWAELWHLLLPLSYPFILCLLERPAPLTKNLLARFLGQQGLWGLWCMDRLHPSVAGSHQRRLVFLFICSLKNNNCPITMPYGIRA